MGLRNRVLTAFAGPAQVKSKEVKSVMEENGSGEQAWVFSTQHRKPAYLPLCRRLAVPEPGLYCRRCQERGRHTRLTLFDGQRQVWRGQGEDRELVWVGLSVLRCSHCQREVMQAYAQLSPVLVPLELLRQLR